MCTCQPLTPVFKAQPWASLNLDTALSSLTWCCTRNPPLTHITVVLWLFVNLVSLLILVRSPLWSGTRPCSPISALQHLRKCFARTDAQSSEDGQMDEQMNTQLPNPGPPAQRSQSHQWELTTLHRANSQHIRRLAWCSARLDAVHLMGSTSQFSSDSYRARMNSPGRGCTTGSGHTFQGQGQGLPGLKEWQNQMVGGWGPGTLRKVDVGSGWPGLGVVGWAREGPGQSPKGGPYQWHP